MLYRRMVLGSVLVGVLLAGGMLFGEQQQPTSRAKGKLPLYWNKLGLSDEQRKRVSAIHAKYRVKIDALRTEISKLEEEEGKDLAKVLTDAQKDQLGKIIAGKALLSETPAEEKKPKDEKKPKEEKKPGDK